MTIPSVGFSDQPSLAKTRIAETKVAGLHRRQYLTCALMACGCRDMKLAVRTYGNDDVTIPSQPLRPEETPDFIFHVLLHHHHNATDIVR